MATENDVQQVLKLTNDWIAALESGNFAWMRQHLADDFLFTSQLFPGLACRKPEFIDIVSGVKKARVDFISLGAEIAGKIIVTRCVLYVEEEFGADLGPGMPSAAEATRRVNGHQLAYCSAWRMAANHPQCFDHHQLGQTD